MKFLEKWNLWKKMVDERNKGLGYGNYEESWSYITPLSAIFYPLIIVIFANLIAFASEVIIPLQISLVFMFIISVLWSLWLLWHWRAYK